MRRNIHSAGWLATLMIPCWIGFGGWLSQSAFAQAPIRHEHIRSDMAPGVAAGHYQLANRALVGHVQPVQLITPKGCTVEVGYRGQFSNAFETQATLGMAIGSVYRFRVSDLPLPGQASTALYPSVEVINRLNPPPGLQQQFPIQIALTTDDFRQALSGRMVTKVIYLEDPRGNLPNKHIPGQQPSFDVGGGEDPLRAAEQLGRPMAIVRMGSRVPMANDPTDIFDFNAPAPQFLPEPIEGVTMDRQYLNEARTRAQKSPVVARASAPTTDNLDTASTPMAGDQVAMAARAQYEAAVAEAARERRIQTASAEEEVSSQHPLPAPIIQSDVPTKVQPATARRPDQLNQF